MEEDKPQLKTVNDPVEPAVVQKLEQLEASRYKLASRLLMIEEDKVRLLRASTALATEHGKIYEQILLERGLDPLSRVTVDEDGKIEVVTDP